MEACEAKAVPKVGSRTRKEDYARVMYLISHPEPDQLMISTLLRAFQPADFERFDGAALVTHKVGQHRSAGPPQPKTPASLPKEG